MAKRTTRKKLVLQERAAEFDYEERMRDNPLGQRGGGYDMYQQQEEEAECDCRRYAHPAQCCEICHEYHPLRKLTLLNGEVIRACAPIDRAIRPAYHAERGRLWLAEHMSTADGRRFLATTGLSFFYDERVMFALQAWNETAPEGEKVDFNSTLLEEESRRPPQ
jgi:hypothetical protein